MGQSGSKSISEQSQKVAAIGYIDSLVEESGDVLLDVGNVCTTCGSEYMTKQVDTYRQNTMRITNEYAKDIFKMMAV